MKVDLVGIHKRYGSVTATAGVNLSVAPGSIHGVLGENGAGKSTLMKILAGFVQPDSGQIRLNDRPVDLLSPAKAVRHGIGMCYQEPLDFAPLTVLENFTVGAGAVRGASRARDLLTGICRDLGFALDPDLSVERLTVGERQQLEIVRLLSTGVSVLILDEPTTGISVGQRRTLFAALRRLASRQKSILLVSHKLTDVHSLCDEVTVLRQGQVAGHMQQPFDTEGLLAMMFAAPPTVFTFTPGIAANPLLDFEAVSAPGGRCGLIDCSISIRQGEVVGLAGLEGSGQGVFLRIAAGLVRPTAGSVRLHGCKMKDRPPWAFKQSGVSFLPAARLEEGLIAGLTLAEHFVLVRQPEGFWVDTHRAEASCRQAIDAFAIKAAPDTLAEALSGGNQQRLLLSLMDPGASLLLLENPTRGLDVASVHWVWQKICGASAHRSIVFSSSEIEEILMVADRIVVFFEGRILLDLPSNRARPEILGRAIAGKIG